jgi:hypothetical protein
VKVEVILHFNIDEEETDFRGQKLLDNIREVVEEEAAQDAADCKVISVKFVEDKK